MRLLVALPAALFAAGVFGAALAQDVAGFIGTFILDMPGMASVSMSSQRVDSTTRETTTTTRIGASASGVGTLTVNADGTWRLSTGFYGPQKSGRWEANTSGPFSDKGGIELLAVRPDLGRDQQSWFVFRNGEGRLEVREPPYTAYNHYLLRGAAAGPAPKAAAGKAAPAPASAPKAAPAPARAATVAQAAPAPAGRQFTVDDFRKYVIGRSAAQLTAEFGEPTEKGYKSLTFSRLNVVDPATGDRFRTASVSFDVDGGIAWYVYLRE